MGNLDMPAIQQYDRGRVHPFSGSKRALVGVPIISPPNTSCEDNFEDKIRGCAFIHDSLREAGKRKRCSVASSSNTSKRNVVQHAYHDHSCTADAFLKETMSGCANREKVDSRVKSRRPSLTVTVADGMATIKRKARGGVIVPFPLKLHDMLDGVEGEGNSSIVSWQSHGRAFLLHKPKAFVHTVMTKYFKQSKLTSFQRQLNLYGFSRITKGEDAGAYYHELFLRGRKFLSINMVRTKVKGTGFKASSSPETEPKFFKMPPCLPNGQLGTIDCVVHTKTQDSKNIIGPSMISAPPSPKTVDDSVFYRSPSPAIISSQFGNEFEPIPVIPCELLGRVIHTVSASGAEEPDVADSRLDQENWEFISCRAAEVSGSCDGYRQPSLNNCQGKNEVLEAGVDDAFSDPFGMNWTTDFCCTLDDDCGGCGESMQDLMDADLLHL